MRLALFWLQYCNSIFREKLDFISRVAFALASAAAEQRCGLAERPLVARRGDRGRSRISPNLCWRRLIESAATLSLVAPTRRRRSVSRLARAPILWAIKSPPEASNDRTKDDNRSPATWSVKLFNHRRAARRHAIWKWKWKCECECEWKCAAPLGRRPSLWGARRSVLLTHSSVIVRLANCRRLLSALRSPTEMSIGLPT